MSRMKREGKNYFCQSCSKTIIDFRDKTRDEIKCEINKDTCGRFTIDQLSGNEKTSFLNQTFFYILTILSFMGFTVKPLNAQTTKPGNDTVITIRIKKIDSTRIEQPVIKENSVPKSRRFFRKKKRYTVIGTPSF
jgi:hypothetical protein